MQKFIQLLLFNQNFLNKKILVLSCTYIRIHRFWLGKAGSFNLQRGLCNGRIFVAVALPQARPGLSFCRLGIVDLIFVVKLCVQKVLSFKYSIFDNICQHNQINYIVVYYQQVWSQLPKILIQEICTYFFISTELKQCFQLFVSQLNCQTEEFKKLIWQQQKCLPILLFKRLQQMICIQNSTKNVATEEVQILKKKCLYICTKNKFVQFFEVDYIISGRI
eukprot:TRINITY_DN12637_c0_g1_i2.p2 TRINITY_DN12637_c0_g1~~TRINITY_DN12637_c0_g1_i2.p2  ORF type:complete len:220 (-),score=-4.71 TRINITY_DN12637_c0_g1_i2:622-1281(-)